MCPDDRPPPSNRPELPPEPGKPSPPGASAAPSHDARNDPARALFHQAPVSLWEVDWSGVKAQVDGLRNEGIEDLKAHYENHPEQVMAAVRTLRVVDFNEASQRLYGAPDRETLLQAMPGLLEGTYWDSFPDLIDSFVKGGLQHCHEGREKILGGEERILRITRSLQASDREDWSRVIEVLEDTTQERRAAEALARSEQALLESQRIAALSTWEWDEIEGRTSYASPEMYRIYGIEAGDEPFDLERVLSLIHPEDRERYLESYQATHDSPRPHQVEIRIIRPDGETRWIQERAEPIFSESGQLTGYRGTIQDITERHLVEEELRNKESALLESQRIAALSTWQWDEINKRDVYASTENFRIYGIPPRDEPLTFEDVHRMTHPDDQASYKAHYEETHSNPRPYATEFRIIRPDGATRYLQRRAEPIFDREHRLTGYRGTVQDVTERRLAEEDLRRSDDALRESQRIASIGTWEWDEKQGCTVYASDELYRVYGLVPAGRPLTSEALYAALHPDDVETYKALSRETHDNPRPYRHEFRILQPDGRVRRLRLLAEPLFDQQGGLTGYRGTTQDITEQWESQEQLRQAYKMKALAQLTGGVAHDFNNLLGIIIGNIELASDAAGDGRRIENYLALALRSAERGADLIQRLLAFSRSQTLKPGPVDCRALLDGGAGTLRHSLGEGIELEIRSPEDLWRCYADAVQLESALLNLALNARDAMPGGGQLTIEAANRSLAPEEAKALDLLPGEYLLLSVSDNGEGMPEAVRTSAVEPFFSTKEVGKGSGLGLSMVYGLARQSGGTLILESQVGKGTTVAIYLPRYRGTAAAEAAEDAAEGKETAQAARQATILLVEDDNDLRDLLASFLHSANYKVLEAESGPKALKILEDRPALDLLLSDMVLPDGMSGRDLVEAVQRIYPGLPVLYASGYPRDAIVNDDRPGANFELLQKPFRKADLIQAIGRTLEAGPTRNRPT